MNWNTQKRLIIYRLNIKIKLDYQIISIATTVCINFKRDINCKIHNMTS